MRYNNGKLTCPKCGEQGMNIFTNWLSREKTVGAITKKQYFFYYFTEKEKSFKCLGFLKRIKYSGDCCEAICFIFTAILYIPIFFIVDIIDWCCVKERMYHIFLENQDNEDLMLKVILVLVFSISDTMILRIPKFFVSATDRALRLTPASVMASTAS